MKKQHKQHKQPTGIATASKKDKALRKAIFADIVAVERAKKGFKKGQTTITITIVVEGDDNAASGVVENFLDGGTLQDAINEQGDARVVSAVQS